MTGRDMIIYILQNDLEDKPFIENGRLIGFMSTEEAAAKFNVGVATVRVWLQNGLLEYVKLQNLIFIPADAKDPRELLAAAYKRVTKEAVNNGR